MDKSGLIFVFPYISSCRRQNIIMSESNSSRLCKAKRVGKGSVVDLSSKNVKLVHFVRHAQVL